MSFFEDYLEFNKGTEPPVVYHQFCALAALSSLVGRKIWIDQGRFNIYCNLYIALVGMPGARKSTAKNVCRGLLRKLDAPLGAEATSMQKLVEDMLSHETSFTDPGSEEVIVYTPTTACIGEMSNFFAVSLHEMIDFLTDIYDEEEVYEYKTKNRGTFTIYRPYFVLLGCTTPEWINLRLKDDVISGGFSRRTLFVYSNEKAARIPRPIVTDEQVRAMERVLKRGKEIKELKGMFKWEQAAADFYDEWYMGLEIPEDRSISGYFESKHIQLLKIAMLLAVSESNQLLLQRRHLERGLELLAIPEKNLHRVFEASGRNPLHLIANQAIEIVEHAGGWVLEKRVRAALHREANQKEILDILAHLESSGQLFRRHLLRGGVNRTYLVLPHKESAYKEKMNE